MTALEILGVRDRFETFPQKWSPAMVAAVEHELSGVKLFAKENLQYMRGRGYKNVWLYLALLVQIYRPTAYVRFKNKLKRRVRKLKRSVLKRFNV
tara:strand:+ start:34 stop:318 length:285 start_codon:yes stop_codon:yes gene_type:complete